MVPKQPSLGVCRVERLHSQREDAIRVERRGRATRGFAGRPMRLASAEAKVQDGLCRGLLEPPAGAGGAAICKGRPCKEIYQKLFNPLGKDLYGLWVAQNGGAQGEPLKSQHVPRDRKLKFGECFP